MAMQQVFGNNTLQGKVGDFYDGLRQLLAGEKVGGTVVKDEYASKSPRIETLSKLLATSGIGLLVFMFLVNGFDFKGHTLVIGLVMAIVGALLPMLMLPILNARSEKARAESIL
jgi:hypothetical protein